MKAAQIIRIGLLALSLAGVLQAEEAYLKKCLDIIQARSHKPDDVISIIGFGQQCREMQPKVGTPEADAFMRTVREYNLAEKSLEYFDQYRDRMMIEETDAKKFQELVTERARLYKAVRELFPEVKRTSGRPPASMPKPIALAPPGEGDVAKAKEYLKSFLERLNSEDSGQFLLGIKEICAANGATEAECAESVKRITGERKLLEPYKMFIEKYLKGDSYLELSNGPLLFIQSREMSKDGINEIILRVESGNAVKLSSISSSKSSVVLKEK